MSAEVRVGEQLDQAMSRDSFPQPTTTKFWALYSQVYDEVVAASHPYRLMINLVINKLGLQPGSTYLDIGFGTGNAIEAAHTACSGINIVGIDHSTEMLDHAKAKLDGNLERTDLRLGNLNDKLPFASESINGAFAINVLYVLTPKGRVDNSAIEGVLSETYRMLHSGSRFVICEPRSDYGGKLDFVRGAIEHFYHTAKHQGFILTIRKTFGLLLYKRDAVKLVNLANHHIFQHFDFISSADYQALLEKVGFSVESTENTYTGNRLIVAVK